MADWGSCISCWGCEAFLTLYQTPMPASRLRFCGPHEEKPDKLAQVTHAWGKERGKGVCLLFVSQADVWHHSQQVLSARHFHAVWPDTISFT